MKKLVLFIALAAPLMALSQQYYQTKIHGGNGLDNVASTTQTADGSFLLSGLFQSSILFADEQIPFEGGNADANIAKYDASGNPVWMKSFGGWADEAVFASTEDYDGNILLTGYFQGNRNGGKPFDADPGEDTVYLEQPGNFLTRDMFVIKLNADGEFIWAKQVSNTEYASNEDSFDIEVDKNNNVYIGGKFAQADFDPAVDKDSIFLTKSGKHEAFLLKLNSDGDFVWVKQMHGGESSVRGIEILDNDDIVVAGDFRKEINFDDSTAYTAEDYNIFMAKFNANGDLLNANTFIGNDARVGCDFLSYVDNKFFIGGFHGDPMILGTDSSTTSSFAGQYDAFLCAYDENFNYLSGISFGSAGIDEVSSIVETNGSYLVAATIAGVVTFTPEIELEANGTSDACLLKLDHELNVLSAFSYGGDGRDKLISLYATDAEVKAIGTFEGTADLNPFEGEDIFTASGSFYDVFFSHYTWDELLSIQENLNKINVNVYPNPTSDYINIDGINNAEVEVYNIQGQLMLNGDTSAKINVSSLSAGQYLIIAKNKENIATSVFIKH